jgi:hypothetical protein
LLVCAPLQILQSLLGGASAADPAVVAVLLGLVDLHGPYEFMALCPSIVPLNSGDHCRSCSRYR